MNRYKLISVNMQIYIHIYTYIFVYIYNLYRVQKFVHDKKRSNLGKAYSKRLSYIFYMWSESQIDKATSMLMLTCYVTFPPKTNNIFRQ